MNIFIQTAFLLYLLSSSALANTSLKSGDNLSAKDKIILTVAIEETGNFPFNYKENGKRKGLSIDLLDYFEANSKYEFEFIALPWPRSLYLVAQNKVDLILTMFKTSKREQIYSFIEPSYGDEVNQLFTLADNKFEFNGQLQQLTPFSIGTLREYSYGEAFDQANHLKKSAVLTEEVLLKMLLAKRVDMVISSPLIFNNIISKEKLRAKVKPIKPYIATNPVHMAIAKNIENAQEIKQTLGQLIQQLKTTPHYQELLDKYQLNIK